MNTTLILKTITKTNFVGKDGKRQYNGLIDVYKKTLASDGIGGLYRGFVISCVGIFIYRGLYFGIYDTVKPIMIGDGGSFLASFALGWGVTVVSGLASYPIDTIRRRMMMTSGTGKYLSIQFNPFLVRSRAENVFLLNRLNMLNLNTRRLLLNLMEDGFFWTSSIHF